MGGHFKAFSAIFPILPRNSGGREEVLLHRRANTGYQDGKWDFAGSGHVDEAETAMQAVVHECEEELGIHVETRDLTFAHVSHRLSKERTYYDLYFIVERYGGTPSIMEPGKSTELRWFPVGDLPEDMIGVRKSALENYRAAKHYSETIEK